MRPDQCGTGRRDLLPGDREVVDWFRGWLRAHNDRVAARVHNARVATIMRGVLTSRQLTTGDDARPAKRCSCHYGPACACGHDCGQSSFWINDDCPHHGDAAYTACLYCYAPLERNDDLDWVSLTDWAPPYMQAYCPTSPDHDHHPENDQ